MEIWLLKAQKDEYEHVLKIQTDFSLLKICILSQGILNHLTAPG